MTDEITKAYAPARRGRQRYKRGKLLVVLRFLSLYNPEAHEDWFAEFGLTPEGDLLQ